VKFIVGTLSDKDHFGLVTFATESRKWKDSLVLAGRDEREAAAKFVDGLQATGGTNIEQALADGLALARGGNDKRRPCYVIFLTDGLPTVQNTDVKAIAKGAQAGREEHIRLFTFGVGYDVNTWLLDTLAEQGRGQREYVKPKEDMELKVSNFAAKVSSPVLSDIKLRIDGAEVSLVEPRTLPDLFAGTQLSVLGRYAKPGRHAVVLEGQVNGARRVYEYTCEFAEKDTSKNYLPRMWAVRRVGYLLDQINVGGFSQELKDEIVKLASRFGIVTPYTSFLIVEDAPLPPARGERPQPRDAGWGERRAIEPRREAGLGGGRGSGDAPQSATGKEKVEESRNNAERRQNDNADGVKDADDKARDELEKKAEAGGFARKTGARAKRLKDAGYTKEVAEAEAANTIKTIGTRTFVWCDDVWVEADITNAELIAATVVEYLSDDYFALAKANDANAKILALGSEVVFRDGKKVVRVYVPQPADSKDDKK
jgi:Ca-activated chloride channel family protein